MALITKADLQFNYSWTAIKPDDPRITGKPDSTLLNRGEGYEVLSFINRFAEDKDLTKQSSALKIERMIKNNLPGTTRSHANVSKWIVDNWSKY